MRFIAERLAHLASEIVQRKFVEQSTASEYLLPEDLLEDAYDVVRLVKTEHVSTSALSEEAKRQILMLEPLLAAEAELRVLETSHSASELLTNPTWLALRLQARACLEAMDFDLHSWETVQ